MPGKNLRIGIIGAGPAGLAAAEALKEQGYNQITLIEKLNKVGGMTSSLSYIAPDGREIIYELGSLQPVSSKLLYRLIDRYGLHVGKNNLNTKHHADEVYLKLYSIDQHKPLVDFTKYKLGFPPNQLLPLFKDLLKLARYLIKYRNLAKPGFNLPPEMIEELSFSCDEWVTKANFNVMELPLRMLGVTMTMGQADIKSDIPVLLLLKLFYQTIQWPPTRLRYLNGLHKFMREGYQELWNRVAKNHNVLLGTKIQKISRHEKEVEVELEDKNLVFDKVIITSSPTQTLTFLDATPEEKELFSKVHYSPGWRVAFLGKGLPHDALYSVIEPYLKGIYGPFLQGFYPEGHVQNDVWLYSAGISLTTDTPIEPHLKTAEKFLRDEFKGEVIQWLATTYWPEYVPHFYPDDVRQGIYKKLENLQGAKNSFYSGGAFCGHSNATVAEYSYAIVKKYF